jgi:hypothetical protein
MIFLKGTNRPSPSPEVSCSKLVVTEVVTSKGQVGLKEKEERASFWNRKR